MSKAQSEEIVPLVYVVMGVSGVGKTTVAKTISGKYEFEFIEGDEFHSEENVSFMMAGKSLSDKQRLPWLKRLSLSAAGKQQGGAVFVACSALKRSYRDIIRGYIPDAQFIHLKGEFDYIKRQMTLRKGHFMPLSLLRSQFEALENLEADEAGLTILIDDGIDRVLKELEAFMFASLPS